MTAASLLSSPCLLALLALSIPSADAQPSPALPTYSNPLALDYLPTPPGSTPQTSDPFSGADPAVEFFNGKWYLAATTNLLWHSTDLRHWVPVPLSLSGGPARSIVAPALLAHDGYLYLAGNYTGLYRSKDPARGFEYVGEFSYQPPWTKRPNFFDLALFKDDDARIYAYFAGGDVRGVYGVELDPANLTRLKGEPVHLFRFNPAHVWERFGDANEAANWSWIEGPWMTRHQGRYYLQYSGAGTRWKTYAVGLYTGSNPLGPFRYDSRSPLLRDKGGLLNGTGHHCTVKGPGGSYWVFYHVLYANQPGSWDRRLAMDPAGFDANGNFVILGPSEAPQFAPGVRPQPWRGNSTGSLPLTLGRYTHTATSSAPGRDSRYALDNNVRTWWAPAPTDEHPMLEIDLLHQYDIDSTRILFASGGDWRYRIEVSSDAVSWRTALDRTTTARNRDVDFEPIAPVAARYLRLILAGGPPSASPGILEFTVFGKGAAPMPLSALRPRP